MDELRKGKNNSTPQFQENLLGGGPWRVVYTRGAFLWQLYTQPGQILVKSRNRAAQTFDPTDNRRSVLNEGQIAGSAIQVSAVGQYTPADDSTTLPKEINVEIGGGALEVLGRKISIPIKGRGKFFIEYLDSNVRIFRSVGGGISVQVREEAGYFDR